MSNILAVDDDPTSADFIAGLLRDEGHTVVTAGDGAEALTLANRIPFDLVIADIVMPAMDGYEFARRLLADPDRWHPRLVFYTAAYHRPSALALAEACGVSRVLAKQGRREDILEAVQSVLASPPADSRALSQSFHEHHARVLSQTVFEQLKQLEETNERLRISESQYRALFETNPFPMWIVDEETHRFLAVNQSAVKHYGYTPEEFALLFLTDISESERSRSAFDETADGPAGFRSLAGARIHRKKSGEIIKVEAFAQATSFNGRPALLELLQDVSDRLRAEEKIRTSEERLHQLTIRLRQAQEEERTRVARYLHDELGQMLTALRLTCTWIAGRIGADRPELVEQIRSCLSLTDEMVTAVQTLSTELRPGVLDLGIGPAIEWYSRNFETVSGIPCNVKVPDSERPVDPAVATELYRIFQEALTNIARHANATNVNVTLAQRPSTLLLEVKDNGRGITPGEIDSRKAIGLLGMRERATLVGGSVSIEGKSGLGTAVRVIVPHAGP